MVDIIKFNWMRLCWDYNCEKKNAISLGIRELQTPRNESNQGAPRALHTNTTFLGVGKEDLQKSERHYVCVVEDNSTEVSEERILVETIYGFHTTHPHSQQLIV